MMSSKLRLWISKQQYSLPSVIFLVMMLGNILPLLLLTLYEFIRFHEVLFAKGDILIMIYTSSILVPLCLIGYIICEVNNPIKALINNIESYRFKKRKPILQEITKIKEFNYLLSEYEKLISEVEQREVELVAQTRLATIGSMATMIAHDVRKPLTAIKMFLEAFPKIIKNNEILTEEIVQDIKQNIQHARVNFDC